jgi:zinc transporter ZupT
LGFSWIERRMHARSARMGTDVVTAALAAHSFADGAALAIAFDGARWLAPAESALLAGALVLHRAPEGLFIASKLLPAAGMQAALRRIGLLAAATLLGALSGRGLLQRVPDAVLGALVAAGLGIMLRLVVHHHGQRAEGPRTRGLAAVCFVASAALVLLLPRAEDLLSQALQQEPPLVGALRASYRNLVAIIR